MGGNPNPSPDTRFGGKRGNKPNGGKTSKQRKAEYRSAEKAAILGYKMISCIMEKIEQGQDPLDFIDPATLKLMKDVQDRAHGLPKATSEVAAKVATKNALDMTDDELAAFLTGSGGEGTS